MQLACERLRQAKYGPLLPSVLLGFSVGGFGGGQGARLGDSSDRTDFDAIIAWEIKNLGLGDQARTEERRSQYRQAQTAEVAVLDRVSSEVSQAAALVASRQKQIALAAAVERAVRSLDLNGKRIYQKEGLPIELLQAIQALAAVRRDYLGTVIEYNQAQFRLHTALGQPALQSSPTPQPTPLGTSVFPPTPERTR